MADPQCGRCAKRKHLRVQRPQARPRRHAGHPLFGLSEPPAVRVTGPDIGTMAFAAFGANILIAANRNVFSGELRTASPSLIYSTDTAALTAGPQLPHDHLCDLSRAMTAGGKLYARSCAFDKESGSFRDYLQVLSSTNLEHLWDPSFRWAWHSESSSSPPFLVPGREKVTCHALHPDGHTIFMSTDLKITYSFDTSNGEWKEVGGWVLPFQGHAYYDRDLDAWVGLHAKEVSAVAVRPPECTMLKERLCRYKEDEDDDPKATTTTLTYLGDGRFCLVDNIPCGEFSYRDGSVVHVTLFGLKYDSKGELRTKAHRTTRSYAPPMQQGGAAAPATAKTEPPSSMEFGAKRRAEDRYGVQAAAALCFTAGGGRRGRHPHLPTLFLPVFSLPQVRKRSSPRSPPDARHPVCRHCPGHGEEPCSSSSSRHANVILVSARVLAVH
ncbi:hypothetical protein HU200_033206 [Digitaria exilis]|uniref:Uncharacterized protein n=1 Tax=Digitaria exilis TaxID=1010633 RepID=A0A835BLM2_9POAL|nr:hypothetical protein HU200_033206 [Digitaria exilis]